VGSQWGFAKFVVAMGYWMSLKPSRIYGESEASPSALSLEVAVMAVHCWIFWRHLLAEGAMEAEGSSWAMQQLK